MRMTITVHRDHLCDKHHDPICHVCHIRFSLDFMTILVNHRPWVALPMHLVHVG